MLVLSRKPQQTIVLSNGAVFKVLGIQRGRVQVGIQAPAGVRILRGECVAASPESANPVPASSRLDQTSSHLDQTSGASAAA